MGGGFDSINPGTPKTASGNGTFYSETFDTLGLSIDSFNVILFSAREAGDTFFSVLRIAEIQHANLDDFSDYESIEGTAIDPGASGGRVDFGVVHTAGRKRYFRSVIEAAVDGSDPFAWFVFFTHNAGATVVPIPEAPFFNV